MKTNHNFQKTAIALIIGAIGFPQMVFAGDFLSLVQYPAGSASREPAPNIIVSVDNSGSMGAAGITALKDALKETFRPANVPDDSIRLAYQSLWGCNTIPSTDVSCNSKNSMKVLRGLDNATDNSHRGNFIKWVDTLVAGGNTPTHRMQGVAGEYLKTTGINNPYNFDPGTTETPIHACRRSYNILMTDGGWNNNPTNTINNDDGTNQTFPDGTSYDITAPETRIYRDDWGTNVVSTLSDMAFYYWRNDLQSGINNQVVPLIKNLAPKHLLTAPPRQLFHSIGTRRTTLPIGSTWLPTRLATMQQQTGPILELTPCSTLHRACTEGFFACYCWHEALARPSDHQ